MIFMALPAQLSSMSDMAVTSTSLIDKRLGRCWRPLPPAPTSAMLTRSLGLARLGVAQPKAKTAGTDAARIERSRKSLRLILSIGYLLKRFDRLLTLGSRVWSFLA